MLTTAQMRALPRLATVLGRVQCHDRIGKVGHTEIIGGGAGAATGRGTLVPCPAGEPMAGGAVPPRSSINDPLPFAGTGRASELATRGRAMEQVFCKPADLFVGIVQCRDQLLIRV